MNEELRLYSFTNFYLSSIQQGIQTGHAAVELFNKYLISEGWQNGFAEQVNEWAANWKTFICLNGGDASGVAGVERWMTDPVNPYAWTSFVESDVSLNGITTTVAIILPARIFDTAALLRMRKLPDHVTYSIDHLLDEHRFTFADDFGGHTLETYNSWEIGMMKIMNSCGLAR